MTNLTLRSKLLLVSILMGLLIIFLVLSYREQALPPAPSINGFVLVQPKLLPDFILTDQQHNPFERKDLFGKWHIISYGYTHCPDICPTTLLSLSRLNQRLHKESLNNDVIFAFYTIDPERDTVNILSKYLGYFSDDFIGLKASDNTNFLPFEQSLGIKVKFKNKVQGSRVYEVSHGMALYLVNPEAKLQAVVLPKVEESGIKAFDSEKLFTDYLKVKKYYDNKKINQKT